MAAYEDGLQQDLAQLNLGQKDMVHFNHDDAKLDQGIASPADCWELVGSGPSSPLPEARVDGSAFEEAIAAACSTCDVLQRDYFACTGGPSDKEVLPLSTVMADRLNEEGHSSCKSEVLVSLDSETEVGENSMLSPCSSPMARSDDWDRGIGPGHGANFMHSDDLMSDVEGMHPDDDIHHSNSPCGIFLNEHSGDINIEHCEVVNANLTVYNVEVADHNVASHLGREFCDSDYVRLDEDNVQSLESTAICDNYRLSSTLAVPHVSGSSNSSPNVHENSSNIQHIVAEEGQFSAAVRDESRESSGNNENLPVMQRSIVNTHNSRHSKVFTCASWLWTHVTRWQAQLGFANTLWSMALAAAVMGILVLGRGWQRLQAQNRSLRAQLWAKEKRITQLMFQLMQTNSLAKARRVPVIYVKPALRIPHDHS